jgi:anti-sigma factor RsiW
MAEVEFSALGRQCLDRRIATCATLARQAARWEEQRNAARATVAWQFTTDQARIKLRTLYPSLEG